ncbi:hypothetical protein K6U06_05980 [Acidiferrimicrobium sp. IK]|uniref:hypothetical protein n=1 Tax=Acidiferrimicrobium sp. IK TaxID=2871700 RepID=UPI0021CB8D27|nr:hypothetical protein [Acidiferrimicrobium sp. IK]MCU4183902.1 hypothetical protein [Acidiferrimicrobium sp. IK]
MPATLTAASLHEPPPMLGRRGSYRCRRRDQRGEGVISAAIAVLIMAFIGVGMWVAFNTTFQHTARNIDRQVNTCIGQTSASC